LRHSVHELGRDEAGSGAGLEQLRQVFAIVEKRELRGGGLEKRGLASLFPTT
jgi:hypothetical protein